MSVGVGMRGTDLRGFMMVARRFQVVLLIRQTNAASLAYIGRLGFRPKPALIKAKTADTDPPARRVLRGRIVSEVDYRVAGLVVHPGFQPELFHADKRAKAESAWADTMALVAPHLKGVRVDLREPDSWSLWGQARRAVYALAWRWRIDVDPDSIRFGCVQLWKYGEGWSYVHGDYDLKDVIVPGHERQNERNHGKIDGVDDYTPRLPRGLEFAEIRAALNREIGIEMVQHGADAQFRWHGEEPITVAYPDWTFRVLADAVTVQGWYEDLHRRVLAAPDGERADYLRDPARRFVAMPGGRLLQPGNP